MESAPIASLTCRVHTVQIYFILLHTSFHLLQRSMKTLYRYRTLRCVCTSALYLASCSLTAGDMQAPALALISHHCTISLSYALLAGYARAALQARQCDVPLAHYGPLRAPSVTAPSDSYLHCPHEAILKECHTEGTPVARKGASESSADAGIVCISTAHMLHPEPVDVAVHQSSAEAKCHTRRLHAISAADSK